MKKSFIRIICMISALLLLFSSFACIVSASDSATEQSQVIVGDVNGDTDVDSNDLILLRQYFAKYDYDTNTAPFVLSEGADTNEDGKITSMDIVDLRIYLTNTDNPGDGSDETIDAEYAADFSVAKIFSSNMVVQRNEQIRVWGFAPESENGKKVSASFKGITADAIIENGEWCITFKTLFDADTVGAEMKIYTDTKEVKFTDVLVGDVYLVMGQSNTAYSVSNHFRYDDPATQGGGEDAIDPNSIIRLNRLFNPNDTISQMGTDYVYPDLANTKPWSKTTAAYTKDFSAIGYYFARQLTEKNPNVPVGLMQISKSGAPLASFLPNDLAEKYDSDYFDVETGKYYSNITKDHMGRYFYNCCLAPISNYAIAGVVWYQGESNNSLTEASKYGAAFTELMTLLRSTHNLTNKDFPVFLTEFPTIYKKPANLTGDWHFMELGLIRSYLGSIPTVLENSYVAASSDLWADDTFYNSLHPNCKYEQSGRLAAIANAVVYKNGSLDEATGPIFESVTISANKKNVVITFSNVGDGLATSDGGTAVKGIVGLDASVMGHIQISPKSATITAKNQITVVFDSEVKAVAYNYNSSDFYGDTINLCNSNGCIASAFISPYKDKEIGTYKSESFKDTSYSAVGFVKKSIDSLTVNGEKYFSSSVVDGLAAANNQVAISQGSAKLAISGWIGFGHKITMFGYSIDGQDAIFDSYPNIAGSAVIAAGGQHAQRLSINIPTGELSVGNHTVDFLALVDTEGGVAVKLLSFTLTVNERVEEPEEPSDTPNGYDAPEHNAAGYGFKGWSLDEFSKINESTEGVFGSGVKVLDGLEACSYTLNLTSDTKKLKLRGWIGFETDIDKFGYALDGAATMNSEPTLSESLNNAIGYTTARKFEIFADISGLSEGTHTLDFLVNINLPDYSKAILKIISVTLIIEKAPSGYDAPEHNAAGYGFKSWSLDEFSKINESTEGVFGSGVKVLDGLKACNYTLNLTSDVKKIKLRGWIGFETDIDKFGYALDGVATMNSEPTLSESLNTAIGYTTARRFEIFADISGLSAGTHTLDYLVRIKMADGSTAVLKIISITLIIEK